MFYSYTMMNRWSLIIDYTWEWCHRNLIALTYDVTAGMISLATICKDNMSSFPLVTSLWNFVRSVILHGFGLVSLPFRLNPSMICFSRVCSVFFVKLQFEKLMKITKIINTIQYNTCLFISLYRNDIYAFPLTRSLCDCMGHLKNTIGFYCSIILQSGTCVMVPQNIKVCFKKTQLM